MKSLFYIVILLVVSGCAYTSSVSVKEFDEAERLMLSDPEAALGKLNGFDVSEFEDSAVMARWALLYSEALVANRLSAPTDTIVNIAVDYYGRHNRTDEYNKASRLKTLIRNEGNSDALATALYLQKEKEFMLYKERAARERYMLAGMAFLLLAAGLIVWMRQRIRLQNIQNNALMAEASSLKNQVEDGRDNVCRLETTLHGLLDTRFALIDALCQTYYETQGTKTEKKAIVEKVKSEIECVRTDSFADMEKAVNDCRDNILATIREDFPVIKPDDYRLLVYLACGLSTRTISLLLDETVDVIYKRKSRLKARLKNAGKPSSVRIIDLF